MTQASGSDRLSHAVRPRHYDLRLEVDPSADGFSGKVAIELELHEPTSHLEIHSLDLDWSAVRLELDGGATTPIERFEADTDRELVDIVFGHELPAGRATLVVDFSGVYGENLVGLYRSEFDVDGETRQLAVTQCESTHARRIAPCFDEPEFKATFAVTLVVPEELTAVSNAAEVGRDDLGDGRCEVRFAPTMVMSSYLLALVVGPLEVTEAPPVSGRAGEIALRVIHPPGKGPLTDFAIEVASSALTFFEQYYDLAYPGDKVDLVAIPDFAFGAMENMGCITFREVLLLVDPERATPTELQRVADVINHELAHMWFGNLVTMKWWNGIWLNEAFATFMEVSASDAFRPEWDVWTSFGLARAAAFETDALVSTRPIEFEVRTAADSEAMFDILTYEKGCSVLRMFEQYLGPEEFRSGIRSYLRQHAYSNTETSDLWDALEAATGEPVRRIAESWIFRGGHPLVVVGDHVSDNDDGSRSHRVRFDQQRALYRSPGDGDDAHTDERWPIPMTVSIEPATDPRLRVLLEEPHEVPVSQGDAIVRPNVDGNGFFRALLSADARRRVLDAVDGPLERFTVLDDTWFAVLAGQVGSEAATTTIEDLLRTDEADPSVWRRICSVVDELIRLTPQGALEARRAWVIECFAPQIERFPADTSTAKAAEVAGTLLSILGHLGGQAAAQNDASALFDEPGSADSAVLAGALDVVAHSPTAQQYDEILRRWREASNPQDEQRHLGAIVSTSDAAQFDASLALCLDEVRTQDAPYVLRRALTNRMLGGAAWRFVVENFETMSDRFPSSALPRMLEGIRSFTDPGLATEVEEFLATDPLGVESLQVTQHVERMQASVEAAQRVAREQ